LELEVALEDPSVAGEVGRRQLASVEHDCVLGGSLELR
jgi:hypothetical protein